MQSQINSATNFPVLTKYASKNFINNFYDVLASSFYFLLLQTSVAQLAPPELLLIVVQRGTFKSTNMK
jgi:hypothetical protein